MFRSESYSPLRVPRSHTTMYGERSFRTSTPRLRNELPNHIKLATSKDIFCKVLKPICFNWRIYNIKPVYYVRNVFDLYELRLCFNCVLNVMRLRAISVIISIFDRIQVKSDVTSIFQTPVIFILISLAYVRKSVRTFVYLSESV